MTHRPATPRRRAALGLASSLALAALAPLTGLARAAGATGGSDKTFDQDDVLKAASDFLGSTTEGLAQVIARVFKEHGEPNATIQGHEAGGALTIGVVYGEGELRTKAGERRKVFWSGPSVGFDAGANASKVFTLVYNLPRAEALFMRFPGVDGSLYYIGGAGVNYQRRDGILLAPIRLGAGVRAGASVGYVHYRKSKSLNPL